MPPEKRLSTVKELQTSTCASTRVGCPKSLILDPFYALEEEEGKATGCETRGQTLNSKLLHVHSQDSILNYEKESND